MEHFTIGLRINSYSQLGCITKHVFVGDDRSLGVVGFKIVYINNG